MNSYSGQLDDTLGKKYSELSPKLQSAARFVLENPQNIAMHSLRQVAKQSGLTPPTFSRLARAVGFSEYEDLREQCRIEIKPPTRSLAQRALAMQKQNPTSDRISRGAFAESHAVSVVANINEMIRSHDLEKIADVADKLSSAKQVYLVGALSSGAILSYLSHMANLATNNWNALGDNNCSHSAAIREFDESSVVLVVSISPYIKRTVEVARFASDAGAEVVAICDDLAAPVLKYTTQSFLIRTESPQFFPSYVAVVTLLEILMGMVVRRLGEDANQRIDSVEKLGHAIGDYVE